MRRFLSSLSTALLLGASVTHAEPTVSATTVRGKLLVSCTKTGKNEGQYRYVLNGKQVRALGSDCAPGLAETHIGIYQVLPSPGNTAVVVLEGVNAYSDAEKLIFVPKAGPASYIETITSSEDPQITRTSPSAFHLRVPTEGYAIDMNHLSRWTCLFDVDFAAGIATGRLATPHEKGLAASACHVKVVKAPL